MNAFPHRFDGLDPHPFCRCGERYSDRHGDCPAALKERIAALELERDAAHAAGREAQLAEWRESRRSVLSALVTS